MVEDVKKTIPALDSLINEVGLLKSKVDDAQAAFSSSQADSSAMLFTIRVEVSKIKEGLLANTAAIASLQSSLNEHIADVQAQLSSQVKVEKQLKESHVQEAEQCSFVRNALVMPSSLMPTDLIMPSSSVDETSASKIGNAQDSSSASTLDADVLINDDDDDNEDEDEEKDDDATVIRRPDDDNDDDNDFVIRKI
ncbi:hypothetical protein L6452_37346 [Arctium lappa]|uniref:Uncharacterized protein n=1 Tax=Arctium lappa TaxID=4217 RepID=A0ACB8Y3F5_ARCLA|nr:hypothetical protein L6452_37346 [Arctium lappa]